MNLGLKSTDRILSNVPFPLDTYWTQYKEGKRPHPFCEGFLTKVERIVRIAEKYTLLDGVVLEPDTDPTPNQVTPDSLRYILVFSFSDATNTYTHNEELWDLPADKVEKMLWTINQKTAQIMAAFVGEAKTMQLLSTEKEGEGLLAITPDAGKSFGKWFGAIAKQFNTANEGNPVFKTAEGKPIPVRFKLTRQTVGKGTNNIQLSLNGNCIERITDNANVKSILSVATSGKNPDVFHSVETKAKTGGTGLAASPLNSAPNVGNSGGFPDDIL